ncbi:hypothetical protein ZIOFF_047261 [Zingiber officinale]|uniref:Uncharacterized protein n=1 Tax=Zingiber officinale TaxID=94328 RepID=A0A8J5FUM9_ZINOF|nr:hypothetical protein ZIOFF_047261 [Zingiber officinale]
MAAATAIAGAIVCELGKKQHRPSNRDQALPTRGVRLPEPPAGGGKIVLQPRLCTLRSYGGNDAGVMRKSEKDASPFFASLADYIESSRKSQQFEIASGRLAMKLDLQQIAEAGGVCVAVIVCAATFAWISSARTRIRQMITLGCNSFVDSLIDSAVEALFCDSELSDWSDEM